MFRSESTMSDDLIKGFEDSVNGGYIPVIRFNLEEAKNVRIRVLPAHK